MHLELPPHADKVKNIHNLDSFGQFLQTYFEESSRSGYFELIQSVFTNIFPERGQNPHYLRFFGRTLLLAAEYGFPESSGHVDRHLRRNYFLDMFDPRHILETGVYLANINLQALEQKLAIKNFWDQKGGPNPHRDREVFGRWTLPLGGTKVELPPPNQLFTPKIRVNRHRLESQLPILTPEESFVRPLSQLEFTGEDAETMPKDKFEANIFPLAQTIFSDIANLRPVFFECGLSWKTS